MATPQLTLTALSLNSTLKVHQSVRNLEKHHTTPEGGYSRSTETDAEAIFQYIWGKIQINQGNMVTNVKWKKSFWYQEGESQGNYTEECSHILECATDGILDWFTKNQRFIKEVKEKVVISAAVEEVGVESDGEEEDNESDFDF